MRDVDAPFVHVCSGIIEDRNFIATIALNTLQVVRRLYANQYVPERNRQRLISDHHHREHLFVEVLLLIHVDLAVGVVKTDLHDRRSASATYEHAPIETDLDRIAWFSGGFGKQAAA